MEYHYHKLALKSRNVFHIPAYLATLLHSNNTKDVKELKAYIRKKRSIDNWISNAFLCFPFKHLMVEKPASHTIDMCKEMEAVF